MERDVKNRDRYINLAEVLRLTSLSANTIRSLEKKGKFPKRRELSLRSVRWWLPDVDAWLVNPSDWVACESGA